MTKESSPNLAVALTVTWSGPFELNQVLKNFNDAGRPPLYDGADYGLYQIYGKHILTGPDTLLYIGRATHQTFSGRFSTHKSWLIGEEDIRIFIGRIHDQERHLPDNDWAVWIKDIQIAECLMIYKYSPNYNSVSIAERPLLFPYQKVILEHLEQKHRLHSRDIGPDDYL
jgi:hypothetical protein